MTEITFDFRGRQLLKLRFIGDVDDEILINSFKSILKLQPTVREWPTIADLREYNGRITWAAIIAIAKIRGRRPVSKRNRTALIANTALYRGLAKAMDEAWYQEIARRVQVFDTEEAAQAWLDGPVARP